MVCSRGPSISTFTDSRVFRELSCGAADKAAGISYIVCRLQLEHAGSPGRTIGTLAFTFCELVATWQLNVCTLVFVRSSLMCFYFVVDLQSFNEPTQK